MTVSNLHLVTTTKQEDGSTTADFVASAYSLNTTPVTVAPAADAGKGASAGK